MEGQLERKIKKLSDGSVPVEELIKFFKKHIELKLDWQSRDSATLKKRMYEEYFKATKKVDILWYVHQPDVILNLKSCGLDYTSVSLSEEKEFIFPKIEKYHDFVFLPDLPSSKYVWFVPISAPAFIWMNNFTCGYHPAKFCLGATTFISKGEPMHFYKKHSIYEFFICGIRKDAYYLESSCDFSKVLFESFASYAPILFGNLNQPIKNGFLSKEELDYLKAVSRLFWVNKDSILYYHFDNWTESSTDYQSCADGYESMKPLF